MVLQPFVGPWPLYQLLDPTLLGPLERANLSPGPVPFLRNPREYVSPPHLRKETDPVSETSCSQVFGMLDDRQSLKTK
jgi:hypothetical protein